ncbi:hypothetical protein [Flavobacterium okayamense]|uniref:Signal peptidase n=1 Tax=Flavobacterium okayamense TaxID=2830782 RepID=A0ABM7S3D0_9FLAO|nr:hypothetical protein [Flavobacterium okayamense]BCY27616.1 hypothetical protein KK2020170_04840 [Flavobacterium okayamense]
MKNISLKILLGLFFICQTVIAQPVDPPADDDPPPAPINQWLFVLFLFAALYAFYILKNKISISK